MSNLENITKQHGYSTNEFSHLQLETIQLAIDHNLDLITIINPAIDELVMNIVVKNAIENPENTSLVPYLYSSISFGQLGGIRKSVEDKNFSMVARLIEMFKRDDLSQARKNTISMLFSYDIPCVDLLADSKLNDDDFINKAKARIASIFEPALSA